jgi:hypothetical protein
LNGLVTFKAKTSFSSLLIAHRVRKYQPIKHSLGCTLPLIRHVSALPTYLIFKHISPFPLIKASPFIRHLRVQKTFISGYLIFFLFSFLVDSYQKTKISGVNFLFAKKINFLLVKQQNFSLLKLVLSSWKNNKLTWRLIFW